jgi:hypothetical protein
MGSQLVRGKLTLQYRSPSWKTQAVTGALAVIATVPVRGGGNGGGAPGAHCAKPLLSTVAIAVLDDVQVAINGVTVVGAW